MSSFADKEENINTEFPTSEWELDFAEANGTTKVSIVRKHKSFSDIEMLIQMGFKEGFTITLNTLESLLHSENA